MGSPSLQDTIIMVKKKLKLAMQTQQKHLMQERLQKMESGSASTTVIYGNNTIGGSFLQKEDVCLEEIKEYGIKKMINEDDTNHSSFEIKTEFMSAVGLVTHERRDDAVRRKRLSSFSSANIEEKSKKHCYLTPVKTRPISPIIDYPEDKSPVITSSSSPAAVDEDNTALDVSSANQFLSSSVVLKSTAGTNTSPDSTTSNFTMLRIQQITSSLTVERKEDAKPICFLCKKTEIVNYCQYCKTHYHDRCSTGIQGTCPKCFVIGKMEVQTRRNAAQKTQSLTAKLMSEKFVLLQKKEQLYAEKTKLELRAAELTAAIVAQAASQQSLLHQETMTSNSIRRIQNLIQTFQKNVS